MDKEKNILDDPTGMDIAERDAACAFILHNIGQVYENADQWQSVSEELRDITPKEIDEYIMALRYSKNLPIKNIQVASHAISDPLQLAELYDYTQTYPEEIQSYYPQKIYFIEGGLSAITIIPILTEKNNTTVHMELLFKTAPFIKALWQKNNTKNNLSSIKFVKPKDLKPKKVVK